MGKSRTFSIYLLKTGYGIENALKDNHGLEEASARHLPSGSKLYVLDNEPHPPWWRNYFGISKQLNQVTKGALVLLPISNKCFALSFGHVSHHLKDESFEYDFGLRTTLNAVDPKKLKSTDIVEPGSARRRRTQLPSGSDLTYFDFDKDSTIIKSLVGKIKDEYIPFFSHATGSSNIRLSSSFPSNRLPELCEKLLALYQSEDYKNEFPGIHNVEPVKDPIKIERLNAELLKAFKEKREELYLTVPDILNHQEGLFVSFSGDGQSLNYPDLSTSDYYDYLESNGIALNQMTQEKLKSHRLNLIDENGQNRESFRIYNCMVFDLEFPGDSQTHHLCDGNWYKVDNNYIAKLQLFLDPYFEESRLPAYGHDTEGEYNRWVPTCDRSYICLDMSNISPAGSTAIEPCDLYRAEIDLAVLYHIKVSTRSALLSHLFAQGTTAIELVESEDESRTLLKGLVEGSLGANNRDAYLRPIDERKFKIVYGIVTKKPQSNRSRNLPLFSRINLMRSIKALRLMKTAVAFCFIEDKTRKKVGQRKVRRSQSAGTSL